MNYVPRKKIPLFFFVTLLLTTVLLFFNNSINKETLRHFNGNRKEYRHLFSNCNQPTSEASNELISSCAQLGDLLSNCVANNLSSRWRGLSPKQEFSLSKLGKILYLGEEYPKGNPEKDYKILIWKYGPTLENRHVKHFTDKSFDPFEKCSVNNCRLSYNDSDIETADIVLFHLQRIKGLKDLPSQTQRKREQIWTFLTDESPFHTFMTYKGSMVDFNNIFNWSMTYRMDSDIPVPYGRTTVLPSAEEIDSSLVEKWKIDKKKDVLVAIMGSNCGSHNHRWEYVKELQKHLPVDVYGSCGPLKCPGHFKLDCPILSKYMFYLAFENSNCQEYLTEKLWWNAYSKGSIPIVMGASQENLKQMLPPCSYISVDTFASPRDLANYLVYLNNTLSELSQYFEWKKYFEILNEHGYFQSDSYHYCRVCEAMNYNSKKEKVYSNLEKFWSKSNCFPSWNSD